MLKILLERMAYDDREDQKGGSHQPAIADADLAPAGGDPEKEQPARRPLEHERCGIETHHRDLHGTASNAGPCVGAAPVGRCPAVDVLQLVTQRPAE